MDCRSCLLVRWVVLRFAFMGAWVFVFVWPQSAESKTTGCVDASSCVCASADAALIGAVVLDDVSEVRIRVESIYGPEDTPFAVGDEVAAYRRPTIFVSRNIIFIQKIGGKWESTGFDALPIQEDDTIFCEVDQKSEISSVDAAELSLLELMDCEGEMVKRNIRTACRSGCATGTGASLVATLFLLLWFAWSIGRKRPTYEAL